MGTKVQAFLHLCTSTRSCGAHYRAGAYVRAQVFALQMNVFIQSANCIVGDIITRKTQTNIVFVFDSTTFSILCLHEPEWTVMILTGSFFGKILDSFYNTIKDIEKMLLPAYTWVLLPYFSLRIQCFCPVKIRWNLLYSNVVFLHQLLLKASIRT